MVQTTSLHHFVRNMGVEHGVVLVDKPPFSVHSQLCSHARKETEKGVGCHPGSFHLKSTKDRKICNHYVTDFVDFCILYMCL